MTDYIQWLLDYFVVKKEHHKYRRNMQLDKYVLAEVFEKENLSPMERAVRRFCYVLSQEEPVVLSDERICFLRTNGVIPEIFTEREWEKIKKEHFIHESGKVCNICPDYSLLIDSGFEKKKEQINKKTEEFTLEGNMEAVEFLQGTLRCLNSIEDLVDRYRKEAIRVGNYRVANNLQRVPRYAPETFEQALQFFRIIHFSLWCNGNYHNTVGRLDQYLLPYLEADLERGLITEDDAFELIEEFFISFNKDNDLYPGIQQGDNGQSLVLGGYNSKGEDQYNLLSELCLKASLELKLIDPKINLRVSNKTPLKRYEQGTHLTKVGLGFPQYSNDDTVVKALTDMGYDQNDAYNYVVAACWEFIVPGKAMDIPNISALSFADAVLKALYKCNNDCTFNELMDYVDRIIYEQADNIINSVKNLYIEPSPYISLMTDGCIDNGKDISLGAKYNNYGIHGTGLSTAVDSLAAVHQLVYDEKSVSLEKLRNVLDANFEGHPELFHKMRYDCPKMGNNDDLTNTIATRLLNSFADSLAGRKNERGGIFRPGTGSAMYYIWHSKDMKATPDGRKKGEEFACNYSPSLFSRCKGPISIIQSFANQPLSRVCNGGPLTIELHDSVFKNEDSIRKTAMFIKSYFDLGGHQMQINAVNRDTLLAAKKNPEKYRNLIVRVWGWSGYFVELDEIYQNHIIKRTEFVI